MLSGELLAQTRTLTGKVTDANGTPIPNASVVVKGTNVGTVTNTDGVYSLTVSAGAKTLVVSSVNMQPQEIRVGAGNEYNFSLKTQDAALQEVVVVGYGTIAKRSLTSSVARVSGEEIANKPVTSFDQALTGKAPGVQINTSSGLIGDNVNIRIRGVASISSGSQPLIVLDGVPLAQGNGGQLYNPANLLAELNPNDIENVEVLKDASAAAVYGSRGSAGVILITTKKGKAGQSVINYDGYVGFNEPSRKMKVLNGDQYNTTINKMLTNAGSSPIAGYGDINGDGKIDTTNTDWQKEAFRKGLVQNHQVSISGGTQKTTYYVSLNYSDWQNYIDVNRQKRGAARLNLTTKAADWLTIGVNAQFSRTKSYGLGSGTGAALSGIPYGPLTAAPNIPVYDTANNGIINNYYIGQGGNKASNGTPNPIAVQHINYDNRDSRRFIGSAFGEAQLIKGLKFKTQINVDYQNAFTDNYWGPEVGDGQGVGYGQSVYNERNTWDWFNTLSYNTTFGDHELNALAGQEYTRNTSFYNYSSGSGIIDEDFKIVNPSNYQEVSAESNVDGVDDGLASYFGWINYGFRKKYLATFNFRADGDSRFGKRNRWGYFPSGSVAWRVTEEEFMQQFHFVNDLKLRASYGITGNNNIGYYPAIRTFEPAQYADLGGATLSTPGNTNLKWERHKQFDIGIDATVFKNTSITLEYYTRKTVDLILDNPVLATLGFPDNILKDNVGSMKNQGIELSISTPVIKTKTFNWTVNFNGAWNKNKVLSTSANGVDIFDANAANDGLAFEVARPGYALGSFYLIRWAGVNPANGLPMFLNAKGEAVQYDKSAPTARQYTYFKTGDSANISASDRVISNKTPFPKIYGGLTQNFTYGPFDASIDLQYAFGFYVYNATKQTLLSYANFRNKSKDILNAWQAPGDNTGIPRLYYGDAIQSQASTRWLEKGDFVRLRNVQIGYSLPKSLLNRIKVSRARFYVQVQNVYTFTGYSGIDPEASAYSNTSTTNSNIAMGIDRMRPYLPRTYTLGVNLSL
jgi:TonB-linked SusC/RagA family outer membrane protein